MAKLNVALTIPAPRTAEGAVAARITPIQQLRRLVMACMLWEDNFYIDGKTVAEQIAFAIQRVHPQMVAAIAIEAREKAKLRHVPLLIARELARGTSDARLVVADLLERIIQRPDELAEFLAIYWKDGKQPLSAQVKKGLARAFNKFDEYALSKYNRDGAIKLRDVLFLSHARPSDAEQEALFKKLVDGNLATADTWETNLSAGADKKETFERLINENQLGGLAMLRNLRNMQEAGVSDSTIRKGLTNLKAERVLPFRFISAAKYAPRFEPELENAMFRSLEGQPKLKGKTALVVDNSGSMYMSKVSSKSELTRAEAAYALAMLVREVCEDSEIIVFSANAVKVPSRRGFALRDLINKATTHSSTYTEAAKTLADRSGYDRIILITDEQSHTKLSPPMPGTKGYVLNVATEQNGIGYGAWNHIDGWSESVIDFIQQLENPAPEVEVTEVAAKPVVAKKTTLKAAKKTIKKVAKKASPVKAVSRKEVQKTVDRFFPNPGTKRSKTVAKKARKS